MQVVLSLLFVCFQADDLKKSLDNAPTSFVDAVIIVKAGKGELLDGKDVVWEGYVHHSGNPRVGFLMLKHKLVANEGGNLVLAHVTYSRQEYFQLGQQIKVFGRCTFKDDYFEVKATKVLYPFEY